MNLKSLNPYAFIHLFTDSLVLFSLDIRTFTTTWDENQVVSDSMHYNSMKRDYLTTLSLTAEPLSSVLSSKANLTPQTGSVSSRICGGNWAVEGVWGILIQCTSQRERQGIATMRLLTSCGRMRPFPRMQTISMTSWSFIFNVARSWSPLILCPSLQRPSLMVVCVPWQVRLFLDKHPAYFSNFYQHLYTWFGPYNYKD